MSRTTAASALHAARSLSSTRGARVALMLGLPLSCALLYLSVRKLDLEAVVEALRAADPTRITLAVLVLGMMYGLQAFRWRWISRHETRLPTRRFLEFVIGGVAINNVVPGRPGDFLRGYWLGGAAGISRVRAIGTVVVDRSADLLTLVVFLGVVLPLVRPNAPWLTHLVVAVLSTTGAGALAVALAYRFRRRVLTRAGRRTARLRHEARNLLSTMRQTLDPATIAVASSLSVVTWALWGLAAWLVAGAVGIHLSVVEIAFVIAIINLGVALPSSPGFVGTYQWLCVSALAVFGVPKTDAFAFSVLLHATWFIPTSVAGAALIVGASFKRSRRPLRPAPDPSAT